jgi:hypothetical protein
VTQEDFLDPIERLNFLKQGTDVEYFSVDKACRILRTKILQVGNKVAINCQIIAVKIEF